MTAHGFTDAVLGAVVEALEPLLEAVGDELLLTDLLADLGWGLPPEPWDAAKVAEGAAFVGPLADAVDRLAAVRGTESPPPEAIAGLAEAVARLVDAIAGLAEAPPDIDVPSPLGDADFWTSFAGDVAGHLLARYLERSKPLLFAWLYAAGVIDARHPAAGDDRRSAEVAPLSFYWDRLFQLLSEPALVMQQVYGWGASFDHARLLLRLEHALSVTGLNASLRDPADELASRHYGPTSPPPADLRELRLLLLAAGDPTTAFAEVGVGVLPIPALADGEATPVGVFLYPYADGSALAETEVGQDVVVRFFGAVDVSGVAGARLRPGTADAVVDPGAGRAELGIELEYGPAEPRLLVGGRLGSRALLAGVSIALVARGSVEAGEIALTLRVAGLELIVSVAEGDGFVRTLTGGRELRSRADVALEWSSTAGLRVVGASGLAVRIPLHVDLVGLRLTELALVADVSGDGLDLSAAVTGTATLGPLRMALDRIGAAMRIQGGADGSAKGVVAGADVGLRFKAPNGVGLTIDAGAVTGGGFLFHDAAKAMYAGALHLELGEITLNAVGLLTTRMPDGSAGFSLVVIVQASGFSPIPLGFGFTLTGVGGLLGINRTVAVDVLRAGVRNRTLDAILFSPDDPVPRAAQIVSTLQSVFPPAADQYLFGPMARIEWGSPTLLTIEIALILELPAPLRLIVLGRLRAALPTREHPIVDLKLDALGVVDFDRRELSIDASLYDSKVGPFALTGDMAARANWGERPDFALAVGGFHPSYTPPAGFPELRRLALALSTGDNPRVRMEAYFALTSNTVQVGASVDFYAEAFGFSAEGGFSFDTLIQFAPFRLRAEIRAYLLIKRGSFTIAGADVRINLVGPAPWEVWGTAKFTVLGIEKEAQFQATFGRPAPMPALDRQDVWPHLRDALRKPTSWSTKLPPASGRLVTLRAASQTEDALVHPLGTVVVSQSVVPLERKLTLFAGAPPKDYDEFALTGAVGLSTRGATYDYFAPAQFRRMTDAEKLSSPSFERMVAGTELGAAARVALGNVQRTPLDYEQSVILDVDQPPERVERYEPAGIAVASLAEHGPAGTAEVRDQGRAKFASDVPGLTVGDPTYVIATRDGLEPVSAAEGVSFSDAVEQLRVRADRDRYQIVLREELSPA